MTRSSLSRNATAEAPGSALPHRLHALEFLVVPAEPCSLGIDSSEVVRVHHPARGVHVRTATLDELFGLAEPDHGHSVRLIVLRSDAFGDGLLVKNTPTVERFSLSDVLPLPPELRRHCSFRALLTHEGSVRALVPDLNRLKQTQKTTRASAAPGSPTSAHPSSVPVESFP